MQRRQFLSLLGAASAMSATTGIASANDSVDINAVANPDTVGPESQANVGTTTYRTKPTDDSPEAHLKVEAIEINLGISLIPLADPSRGADLRVHRCRTERSYCYASHGNGFAGTPTNFLRWTKLNTCSQSCTKDRRSLLMNSFRKCCLSYRFARSCSTCCGNRFRSSNWKRFSPRCLKLELLQKAI